MCLLLPPRPTGTCNEDPGPGDGQAEPGKHGVWTWRAKGLITVDKKTLTRGIRHKGSSGAEHMSADTPQIQPAGPPWDPPATGGGGEVGL